MKLIQPGNNKLNNQYMFNLPATKAVCNRICKGCYAAREQVRFPSVLAARDSRLDASKLDSFVTTVITEINNLRKPFKAFRIHASGEFYSQEYINKWESIAKKLPKVQFYAFTKRMKDFDFSSIMSLSNVVIIDSMMHGGLNYDKLENLSPSIKICPATVSKSSRCGIDCNYCWTKEAQTNGISFVKH